MSQSFDPSLIEERSDTLKRSFLGGQLLLLGLLWLPLPAMKTISPPDAKEVVIPPRVVPKPIAEKPIQTQLQEAKQRVPMPPDETPQPELLIQPEPIQSQPNMVFAAGWDLSMPEAPAGATILDMDAKGLTLPTMLKRVQPEYPAPAQRLGLGAEVILEVVLQKDGTLGQIRVVACNRKRGFGFEDKAIEALKQWEFVPGSLRGHPVNVRMTVRIDFQTN